MPTEPWSIGKLSEEEVYELADILREKYVKGPGFFTAPHDLMVGIIVDAGLTVLGDFPMDMWRQGQRQATAPALHAVD